MKLYEQAMERAALEISEGAVALEEPLDPNDSSDTSASPPSPPLTLAGTTAPSSSSKNSSSTLSLRTPTSRRLFHRPFFSLD